MLLEEPEAKEETAVKADIAQSLFWPLLTVATQEPEAAEAAEAVSLLPESEAEEPEEPGAEEPEAELTM